MELNNIDIDQSICQSKYFQTTLTPNTHQDLTQLSFTNSMKSNGYKTYETEKLSYYHTPDYSTEHTHPHHVLASHHNSLKTKSHRVTKAATQEANDKPFKCTVPGCIKSYKNPNGLKYHAEHGHRSALSDTEEKKPAIKPYRCNYPECEKRYKNPNGLKYHLEHAHAHHAIIHRG
ncbi:4721_t:CDS:1 [Funneliformis geosporum]|uniref:10730_t:CDS:1 n=1 Tax=Funneliformis geosporum TaxID=1117311 RepID=A0A9W4SJX5_9GLOM|nr:10730_t:CDS:1 [Funneliformis geosporum]CAI2179960.1 4721_t:CDS:1 [Funneliformis geosporum]